MMRHVFRAAFALAIGAGLAHQAPAQDPVEFSRLSTDQRQLAEQVRRLEKILETLEAREREQGAEARAELLMAARLKLTAGKTERPLASLLEEVAADLLDLRAGTALEQQAELIRFLEELLDFLLETERREQVQELMEAAREREARFRDLAEQQAALRNETEALQEREAATGEVDAEERERLAQAQAELNEAIRQAAEEEAESAGGEQAEQAAEMGEQAETELAASGSEASNREGEATSENAEDPEAAADAESGAESESESESEREAGAESGAESEAESESETESGTESESSSEPGSEAEAEAGSESSESPKAEGENQAEPGNESEQGSEAEPSEPNEGQPPQAGQNQPSESQPSQPQSSPRSPQGQTPQEQLDRAQDLQEQVEQQLQDAADQAAEEADRLDNVDELDTLLNVLEKCEELLARHERVVREYGELVVSLDGATRVPRSARVNLRKWASEQKDLSEEADELLFEIREAGAESFPFILNGLVDDHLLLAKRLGPPKYKADRRGVEQASRIQRDWTRLIDAIQSEAERLRNKVENGEQPEQQPGQEPGEQPEPPPSPLVSMAEEVSLLKLLQQDLVERMRSLKTRQDLLAEAGVALDEDELAELELLVERQKRLRTLFENILARLQEDQAEIGEDV